MKRLEELLTMAQIVPPDTYMSEHELMRKKPYALRFKSPLEATIEFGNAYKRQLQAYIRVNVDVDLVPRISGVSTDIPDGPKREFTSLWKARAFADQFTLPYDAYLRFCFEFAGGRKRRMAPRPNQLGPNKSTEAAWYSKFEKFLTECQDHYFANSEYPAQFRVESYQGLPPQRDFRDDLLEFIRRDKTAYRHQMAKWAYSKRLIPYQDIATLIPEGGRKFELLQLGAGLADGSHGFAEPSMYVAPAEFELLPSCYAVPFAQDLATEQCAGCPLAGACKGDALWVALKSDMNISSSAPQKDHARKLTRARVARHRERLRGE